MNPRQEPNDAVAGSAPPEKKLGKSLQPRHVNMIAIGGIIGAGLFVGSSTSIATVGPAVVLSYLIAGAVILFVMRMLTEMAVVSPGVGSFTELIRLGLGNWAGFLSGWLYWYFWVVVVAIEAIAGAVILEQWLPFEAWQIGVVLLALMTAVNLMSARAYGEFEFWFSSLKVAAIVAFIAIAGCYAAGFTAQSTPVLANLTSGGGFMPHGFGAVLAGVTSVIFALTGAEIATIAAAESAAPERTIARITTSVAVRILLFYVVSIALIVAVVPWTTIVPGISPFTTALDSFQIPGAALIMNWIILVAVLSCLNSGLYVTSRVLFMLAAKGDAPPALVAVNRRQIPARAIIVGSLFGYAALAASVLSPGVVFSFLVNASGATMLIIYALLSCAQIRRRRLVERTAPQLLTAKMWFYPWSTYGVLAAIGAILIAMMLTPALSVQFWASIGVAGLVAVIDLLTRWRYSRATSAVAPAQASQPTGPVH